MRCLADALLESAIRQPGEVVIMHLNEQTFELSFDLDGAIFDESTFDQENDSSQCSGEFDTDPAEDK